jgi:trimeric autotransporter adhesin
MRRSIWCLAMAMVCRGQGIITTFAGSDVNYPGTSFSSLSVSFGQLRGVATDSNGNVYFSCATRSLIAKFNPSLNSVSIVAGIADSGYSGDGGPAINAALNSPQGIVFDGAGNLYIADDQNYAIRKIDTHGVITTVASFASIQGHPLGIAVGPGGTLYVSTFSQILQVGADGTTVIAGSNQQGYGGDDGPATAALFSGIYGLAIDSTGNILAADTYNSRIRRIDVNGIVTTFAGNGNYASSANGSATATAVAYPSGVGFDGQGNLYTGTGNGELVKIDSHGNLTVLNPNPTTYFYGAAGAVANALMTPQWPAFDPAGNLYFTDGHSSVLWEIKAPGTQIQVTAAYAPNFGIGDNGPATLAGLDYPFGIWLTSSGSLLIADYYDQRVRSVSASGKISTVAGSGSLGSSTSGPALAANLFNPMVVASDSAGNVYFVNQGTTILRVGSSNILSNFYDAPSDSSVYAIAVDNNNNVLAAVGGQYNEIARISPAGAVTVIAGGNSTGYGGDNESAINATLDQPRGVVADNAGNVYLSDFYNGRIRKIDSKGIITTIAGGSGLPHVDGVPATQSSVDAWALALDGSGNLYVVEYDNEVVRMIDTSGIITTIAGTYQTTGFSGDGGPATAATLNQPNGVAVDGAGNIYISDSINNRVREILAAPPSITVSTNQVTVSGASGGGVVQTGINVTSSAPGLAYSVSFATQNGGDWLGVSLLQAQAPSVFSILANPGSLAPGNYAGTVTISSASSTPQVVLSVTFQVSASVNASLGVGSSQLSFGAIVGNAPTTSSLTISNLGSGTLSFTASATTATGGGWLQISAGSGTASAGAPASLTVTATVGTLAVGAYTGTILVTSPSTGQTAMVPVTLTINSAPQKILLSQAGLTFTAVAQGGSVLPQTFGILNIGSGSMPWSATAAMTTGSGWLSISPTTGTVEQPFLDVSFVSVMVNAQALSAGQYFGTVQITSPGASNSPQTVVVVLDVLAPGTPLGPQVSPSGLVFTGVTGAENPGAQTVTIANTGSAPIVYGSGMSYATSPNWISYLPGNATINPDEPQTVTVQPNFANLQTGYYRGTLTLTFDNGSILTVAILAVLAPSGSTAMARRERSEPQQMSGCSPMALLPLFTQVGTSGSVSTGFPVAIVVEVVDNCGNPLTNGSVTASFSDGDSPLSMISLQNGQWAGTWQPQHSSPVGVTVSLSATYGALSGSVETLVGFQGAQSVPTASGGVVNAVTLMQGPVAPGEIVLISGSGLADAQVTASTTPLMQQLGGASVLTGGTLANLLYADAEQLITQIPLTIPVNTTQQMLLERDSALGIPAPISVAAAQPAVFTADGSGLGQGLIYQANASGAATNLANEANPVSPGDAVIIYCAGLGAPDSQGTLTNPASVSMGGMTAQVTYAGAAIPASYPTAGAPMILGLVSAGLGGLYQINAVVPAGLPSGPISVVITSAGQSSPSGVTLSISNGGGNGGPAPIPAGVLNAASFAKNASGAGTAVAPGSLVQVYSSLQGATQASASPPYLNSLGGVSVTFDGIPAAIQSVNPGGAYPFINAQLPFEVTGTSASMVVTVNNVPSAPFPVPITPQAPGIFTFGSGSGNAVLVNLSDYSVAAPSGSIPGLNTHPIARGQTGYFYVTGLGALTPAVADGTANCASASGCTANLMPTVTVGGVAAQVVFAGQAGAYPGVDQINIVIPLNSPTGSAVALQMISADGLVMSNLATVAIQ